MKKFSTITIAVLAFLLIGWSAKAQTVSLIQSAGTSFASPACPNQIVNLSATISGIATGGTYNLYSGTSPGGNLISSGTFINYSFTAAAGPYYVTYTLGSTTIIGVTNVFVTNISSPIITGDQSICSSSTTYTITNYAYASNASYTITATNGSGVSIGTASAVSTSNGTFSISWTGTFTANSSITITEHIGSCSATYSLPVYACCNGNSGTAFYNTNSSNSNFTSMITTVSGQSTILNHSFSINGTFTFSTPGSIYIDKCFITMGVNAKIIINPGTAVYFRNSHIYSCDEMWDGMYLNGNTAIVKIENSLVEDAKSAVNIDGNAQYKFEGSIFNRNYRSLAVNNLNLAVGDHGIVSSIFTCRDLSSAASTALTTYISNVFTAYVNNPIHNVSTNLTGGNFAFPITTLKAPYSSRRTYSGAENYDCISIAGGGPLLYGYANTTAQYPIAENIFDWMDYGIKAFQSNVASYFNYFENIEDPTAVRPVPSCAIWASSKNYLNFYLTVGDGTTANANQFYDCSYGVQVWYYNTSIFDNSFTKMLVTAVDLEEFKNYTHTVQNNQMYNVNGGVLANTNGSYTTNTGTLTIANNNPIACTTPATAGATITNYGIYVKQTTEQISTISIASNNITDPKYGIYVIRTDNTAANNQYIANNTINFSGLNSIYSGTTGYYGILVQNSKNAQIISNTITKNGSPVTPPASAMVTTLNGIGITGCPIAYLNQNVTQRMGSGIYASGATDFSTFTCNTLDYCYYGFRFSSAVLHDQLTSGVATGNSWSNIQGQYRDISGNVIPSVGTSINWNWQGYHPYNTYATNVTVPNQAASTTANCITPPPPLMAVNSANRELLFGPIVRDEKVYDTLSAEFKLKDSIFAFGTFATDNTWLTIGTTDDAMYKNFYNYCKNNPIGEFQQVKDTVQSDTLAAAMANENIPTKCKMDDNQKAVNTIYLNHIKSFNPNTLDYAIVYDSISEIPVLESVAYQNPLLGGDAVYMARVMLGIDVLDLEETLKSKLTPIANSTENDDNFKLYPNPNDGKMQLNYKLNENETGVVSIYNVLGVKVNEYRLDKNSTSLSINESQLNEGIYFYKVLVNDKLVKSDKLVISK